jgi:hypothetical protein
MRYSQIVPMRNLYTLSGIDEKGQTKFYTGRGFSNNPDLAISSLSINSVDLYLTWGKIDHPDWTDWTIRISS